MDPADLKQDPAHALCLTDASGDHQVSENLANNRGDSDIDLSEKNDGICNPIEENTVLISDSAVKDKIDLALNNEASGNTVTGDTEEVVTDIDKNKKTMDEVHTDAEDDNTAQDISPDDKELESYKLQLKSTDIENVNTPEKSDENSDVQDDVDIELKWDDDTDPDSQGMDTKLCNDIGAEIGKTVTEDMEIVKEAISSMNDNQQENETPNKIIIETTETEIDTEINKNLIHEELSLAQQSLQDINKDIQKDKVIKENIIMEEEKDIELKWDDDTDPDSQGMDTKLCNDIGSEILKTVTEDMEIVKEAISSMNDNQQENETPSKIIIETTETEIDTEINKNLIHEELSPAQQSLQDINKDIQKDKVIKENIIMEEEKDLVDIAKKNNESGINKSSNDMSHSEDISFSNTVTSLDTLSTNIIANKNENTEDSPEKVSVNSNIVAEIEDSAKEINKELKSDVAEGKMSKDYDNTKDMMNIDDSITISNLESSFIDINTEHGLHKPDAMIEIPSQVSHEDFSSLESLENFNEIIDSVGSDIKETEKNSYSNEKSTLEALMANKQEKALEATTIVNPIEKESNETQLVVQGIVNPISYKKPLVDDIVMDKDKSPLNPITMEVEPQPSTSKSEVGSNTADAMDEVPEVTDSLGLLAESSRVVDDDDEPDDDDGDDDDEESDQDDDSNPNTVEHSEDSNALHSESDATKDVDVDANDMEVDVHDEELDKRDAELDAQDVDLETQDADLDAQDADLDIQDTEMEAQDVELETQVIEQNIPDVELDACNTEPAPLTIELGAKEVGLEEKVVDTQEAIVTDTLPPPNDEERREINLAINSIVSESEPCEVATADTTATPSADSNLDTDLPKEKENRDDIETVKLSDTSDNEAESEATAAAAGNVILRGLLSRSAPPVFTEPSPRDKAAKLEISQPKHVVNIVDLEESSSEDDVQEAEPAPAPSPAPPPPPPPAANSIRLDDVTSVNLPTDIEIMCTSAGATSEIHTKQGELVISGVPKPRTPSKPARLNTSELTIKTTSVPAEPTLVIPETVMENMPQSKKKSVARNLDSQVFSLDSDEEDAGRDATPPTSPRAADQEPPKLEATCVNPACPSDGAASYLVADVATLDYYDVSRKKRATVCQPCAQAVVERNLRLMAGIRQLTPLLRLDMRAAPEELVEISDSDEDEGAAALQREPVGAADAKFLEDQLADMLNGTWCKYNMDERLKAAEKEINTELNRLETESKEIGTMLTECEAATDKLRNDLYGTFEKLRVELEPLIIVDTPLEKYTCSEETGAIRQYLPESVAQAQNVTEIRQSKRRLSSATDQPQPAKRPAIPMGYTPLPTADAQSSETKSTDDGKVDDDSVDVSVVKLSAEAAPEDLPPPGELSRPALRVGDTVYAMRKVFGSWLRAKIVEITDRSAGNFTMCRVRFEHKVKNPCKALPARCLAYLQPADVRLTIGTRVIALFKDSVNKVKRESYYSGVVAEVPTPVNNYRYLVFFDDGYAQYVRHSLTRLVCECAPLVWEEVHPFSRDFIRQYLLAYPERPMVRLHAGQTIKTEWNGKWWVSRVIRVDASLVQVRFDEDNRTEWIYRGSTRLAPLYLELQAAERHRARPMPRSTGNKAQPKMNMPYVEYTRSDEQDGLKADAQAEQHQDSRPQRAVAKKSTAPPSAPAPPAPAAAAAAPDAVTSRVVYYTPKNAVRPYKMSPHTCGPRCRRGDVLALRDLRTYNPLAKPLLSGWERQIARSRGGGKQVLYRAPCGRRVRSLRELHAYLRAVRSDMGVDLFDFHPPVHCLAEFVLNKCLISKKDLSHGKENVPVPCVNYYDESLPEFCSYNTERTPTAGVPLNLDPEFLCGCDCTDDCQDKTKCACWKLTLEGARTIGLEGDVGYQYKRLPEPLPTGIYECNSRCKCKETCLNRVAQHPLQLKLQVFKTLNRGWGIRALNDVPKGAFLCVYAGNLLTDATANLDGLNEGDEYLAELDYIEVVEQMKEGFEEDIPDADKELDKKESGKRGDRSPSSCSTSSEESGASRPDRDDDDDDFRPQLHELYSAATVTEFNKRLRKRDKKKQATADKSEKEKGVEKDKEKKGGDEECITISDDEELREPSSFTAQAGMGANAFVSKYRSVRSYFGKDEACYIMDAKVQGNIGRYLNHSCTPNVFVQNVFVDTHDLRFPWVAFFALNHIRAGTELTWNYNYDVGSVPGKVLYCYCGAPICRGRLL